MAELSGKSSQIKVDAATLAFVTATYNRERDIVEVPPDTATTGKKNIDPDIYGATLSIVGNVDGAAANPLETAFLAGGASNSVSITVTPNSSLATVNDVADYTVTDFNKGLEVGSTQQYTAELMSDGAITSTRTFS
jgi:hypothetical protein